jgi:hypothetical protein
MYDKRFPRDRKKKRTRVEKLEQRYVRDPLFGSIPLIHHQSDGSDGKVYEWWEYDPNYQPPMPRHAVRGDIRKQIYCRAHHTPKYFYVDETRECIQCGNAFVFRATEQKYWYETLKFNFSSIPVRCIKCRRERRSEHALREQIARAKASVRSNDPAAHIALARAIVEYHEKTDHGDLNEAIAAARKAQAAWPESVEPSLWEGIAHARAGRPAKARAALTRFLSATVNAHTMLRKKAENYL